MIVIVAVLSLPFIFIFLFKPILRRLAIRNAVRRPRESLLVILGSLLGTAVMTGSFVVGDTFDASIRETAYTQLGPTDEVVSTSGVASAEELWARFDDFTHPDVDGVLNVMRMDAATATIGDDREAEPRAQVLETDFAAAREFGDDPAATGMSGPTPAPGEAVIVDDLASSLGADVGDDIEVFAYGTTTKMRVVRILEQQGIAGFWPSFGSKSNNLFVAPGTIQGIVETAASSGEQRVGQPPQGLVLVSNTGGVEAGAALSDDVSAALREQISGLDANVEDVKADTLDAATEAGSQLTQLYTSLGTFAVLAGVLLLVNIFFMLADERKSELGMLRAVGLRRASLLGAFAAEGWIYSILAAFAGTFVGLGLGRLIMAGANTLFSASGSEEDRLRLKWAFEWSSVLTGLTIGFVISLTTVVITSIWLSRFNIIQAIRDINEPQRRRPRKRAYYGGLALAALGLLLTGLGAGGGAFFGIAVGPALVLVGIGPALARNFPRERVTTAISIAVLVWSVLAVPVAVALDADIDIFLFVIQGLLLVGAAVVLVTQHQSAIGHAVGRLTNRSLRVRLGLAYPLARRFRTAMTLGMFSLVVFILVYVSVFSEMFAAQTDNFTADVSGGFNVIVSSNPTNPIPVAQLEDEPGVTKVAPLVTLPTAMTLPDDDESQMWLTTGFDEALIDGGAPTLDDRGSYPTDEAAWQDVLRTEGLVIVDEFFLARGTGPPEDVIDIGDTFTAADPITGATRELTVAAKGPNDWVNNGALVGVATADALFGERAVASRAYVNADDPQAFADSVEANFIPEGAKSEPISTTVSNFLAQQQQFFLLMRGYLALGLIVGVAGIGVIMVRAVRERRRQVGVLRALGFEAGAVRHAFVIESGFVAVEGVLIGVVLALITSFSITFTDVFGDSMQFRVPWLTIFVLVVGTLICALLATLAPASSAAKIQPAVALRIAD